MVSVDWRSIRPLNGGRDKGFEETCSQLARWEVGDRARFIWKALSSMDAPLIASGFGD